MNKFKKSKGLQWVTAEDGLCLVADNRNTLVCGVMWVFGNITRHWSGGWPPHAPFADAGKLLLLCVPWVTCDFSASSSRIPAGALLMIMQKVAGETFQEKRNRERRELYEQKLVEW